MDPNEDRLPLPSEDGGDLVEEPPTGMSEDPMVATSEGVPYTPPMERVMGPPTGAAGPDVAGAAPDDAGELERADLIQGPNAVRPADDALAADVIEALRTTDLTSSNRIRVSVTGHRVVLTGEVDSMDVLDEILGMVGDLNGVEEVEDQLTVYGM